jgi:hypothetical protein
MRVSYLLQSLTQDYTSSNDKLSLSTPNTRLREKSVINSLVTKLQITRSPQQQSHNDSNVRGPQQCYIR